MNGGIGNENKGTTFGNPKGMYQRAEITTSQLPDYILESDIESVSASDRWSRMAYLIKL